MMIVELFKEVDRELTMLAQLRAFLAGKSIGCDHEQHMTFVLMGNDRDAMTVCNLLSAIRDSGPKTLTPIAPLA